MKIISKLKTIIFLAIVSIVTFNITSTALSYSIMWGTCNFSTNQYSLYYDYYQEGTKDYSSYIKSGVSAWNYTTAHIYMFKQTDPDSQDFNITFTSKEYGSTGWHGHCQAPIPILWPDNSYIKINESYQSSFSGKESELVAHELGHSFRLDDVSDTTVLMRNSGYKGSPNPTQDDIDGVNSNY